MIPKNFDSISSIFGIGTDIVSIARIQKTLSQHPEQFCKKVLTNYEFKAYQACPEIKKCHYVAKRWATKEAFAKALGTGFRDGIKMTDCETRHNELGKPNLIITGQAKRYLSKYQIKNTLVSVSDEDEYAMAFIVLEI